MSETEIRIARRLATYMKEVAEQGTDMHFFQGLGLALAVVFEEVTLKSARDLKPQEILNWAMDLPTQVTFPHVS